MQNRINMRHGLPGGLILLALLIGCSEQNTDPSAASAPLNPDSAASTTATAVADYIGSEACGACHEAELASWRDSHHDQALMIADDNSVLAEFSGDHAGSSFTKTAGQAQIIPESGADPKNVVYTFGVAPLQQYVIPAERGALQTFPIAWDARPTEQGGQRWFNLQEGVFPAGDPMHWTGRANRWNSQCADCHSTAVKKNYDPLSRSYATSFAAEDVGCEACHGPGSLHVEDPTARILANLTTQTGEINACASCHSRRTQLAEGFRPDQPYLDHYAPRLLSDDLYYVDGQINDEVFVYGSFLQSRMHQAGVTCSNCHEPHSATLKRPGNETCTFCHQGAADTEFAARAGGNFDTPDHHLHAPDSDGAQCVSCHMAAKTYMGVDDRRDHSFRIPRPDLAAALNVPDACTGCHQDRSTRWAADVIETHFGPTRPDHFAGAFAAALEADPEADAALAALVADPAQPIMVRASALARLGSYQRGYTLDSIRLARNAEPLLRFAAPQAASSLTVEARWRLLEPLLNDELRAVRHQAVSALLPTLAQDPSYRDRLAPHLDTWLSDQQLNRDFPEVLTNIAAAQVALGLPAQALATLEEALAQQPSWVPGLMNLADLYRATGRDPEAGQLLEQALTLSPDEPEVAYGYALWLSRQGRLQESLGHFEQAALLEPNQRLFGYAWAIALNDSGESDKAVEVIEELLTRWPDDPQLLLAAITMLRDQGRFSATLPLLDRLLRQRPGDQQLQQFRQAMARAAAAA